MKHAIVDNILGPDVWLPSSDTPCLEDPEVWTDAKKMRIASVREKTQDICKNECPFTEECLKAALAYEGNKPPWQRHGIWGGLSPVQRHKLHKANLSSSMNEIQGETNG